MSTTVKLIPVIKKNWAGMIKYPNCFDDLSPYYEQSGTIYTGLGDKEMKALQQYPEFTGVDLGPNSTFWKTFKVRVPKEGVVLDKTNPNDLLKYYFLSNGHSKVKIGLTAMKAGAEYALIDDDEEAKKENVEAEVEIEAIYNFKKLTASQKKDVLRLYNENADHLSDEVVHNKLWKAIKNKPSTFVDKWVNNSNKDTEVLLHKAMAAGIIRLQGGAYYIGDPSSGKMIGHDRDEVLEFLSHPKNTQDRIAIMRQLDPKKVIVEKDKKDKE